MAKEPEKKKADDGMQRGTQDELEILRIIINAGAGGVLKQKVLDRIQESKTRLSGKLKQQAAAAAEIAAKK